MKSKLREIWKDIPGYEGYYQVSDRGRIFSVRQNKIRKTYVTRTGYEAINLYKNTTVYHTTVHRLVALMFVENPYGFPEVNHIDENKLNNCPENLEWCTRKYNQYYSDNIRKRALAAGRASKLSKSKAVLQFTLGGLFIRQWFSAREAEAELGIFRQNIQKCCRGLYKQCGGFIWKWAA